MLAIFSWTASKEAVIVVILETVGRRPATVASIASIDFGLPARIIHSIRKYARIDGLDKARI
jgi:hypothetical protein